MPEDGRIDDYLARRKLYLIILSLFLVSTCAMAYEYFLGAMASYLLGEGQIQWALSITTMMVAMGFGGYFSRYVTRQELAVVANEMLIAVVGGFSSLSLYAISVYLGFSQAAMLAYMFGNGLLLGLQVPLFMHIIRGQGRDFRAAVAEVTLFDFLGAVPAVALYVLLLREVGLVRGPMLVALVNLATVGLSLVLFRREIGPGLRRWLGLGGLGVLALLLAGLAYGEPLVLGMEQRLYDQRIIYQEQTTYQRIVLTRRGEDVRLFLNGNLQFASQDEYRYHEALVHPAMSLAASRRQVLILGGGDGLALREVWKYGDVEGVTLVDIDPAMTKLGRENPWFTRFNRGSFLDPRLKVVNTDAFRFLEETREFYDVIIVDLPDPNNEALAKLYTREFYSLAGQRLAAGGMMVVQSTSPYFARPVFWTAVTTVAAAGLEVVPYHVYVPSFGDWGFTLASHRAVNPDRLKVEVPARFLNQAVVDGMFAFGDDVGPLPGLTVSTLVRPVIQQLYQKAWQEW